MPEELKQNKILQRKQKHFYGLLSNLHDFPKKNILYQNTDGSQLPLNSYLTFKHHTFKLFNHLSYAEFIFIHYQTSDKPELSE